MSDTTRICWILFAIVVLLGVGIISIKISLEEIVEILKEKKGGDAT